jgi:Heat induced stress protein YflT domain
MATSNNTSTRPASPQADSQTRATVASYPSYAQAEHAVDSLSDQGVAVEHTAIVGKGLRSVEQVTGRMTAGRASLVGLGQGVMIGTLFALLFGLFFNGPAFGYLLLYSVVAGGLFGLGVGLFGYALDSDGRRDFVSETSIEADGYEVQADSEVAAEAKSVLASTPSS